MIDSYDGYNLTVQGETPPAYLMKMLNSPAALRARAWVRLEIARQDDAVGNSLAAWRNRGTATRMLLLAERLVP
jgi:hypothetical protein